jgi:putative ABC transport system substrate-binding protein
LAATLWPCIAAAANVVLVGSVSDADTRETLEAVQTIAPAFVLADVDAAETPEQLQKADVVLAVGPRALALVERNIPPDKPIVYSMVPAGGVTPGKTVTGIALEVPAYVQLAQWKQLKFDSHRVGVIYDPKVSAAALAEATKAAGALGMTLVSRRAETAAQVRTALAELAPQVDVLWMLPDRRLFTDETARMVLAFSLVKKLPLLAFSEEQAQSGALLAALPDAKDIGRRAARMALALAARAPEQRVPVPAPASSPGCFTVNARTAEFLGIDIPEGLLRKARKIYR